MNRTDWIDCQRYSECQVVTAINSWICLTCPTVKEVKTLLDSKYEHFVDISAARNGAAIWVEKVHDELGIMVSAQFERLYGWEDAGCPLPIDISVWHPRYGFHSVCCVEFLSECSAMKVLNFQHETTSDGSWIFQERLAPWIKSIGSAQKKYSIKLLKRKYSE